MREQLEVIDRYGYPFCRGRILHELEETKGNTTDR